MRRSARLTENQDPKLANEAQEEPKAKLRRSANRISKIAALDSGTMVEALKYLNYCQLAKNSLVSKRFLDVIRTHRHKLALFYVNSIRLERHYRSGPADIKIFNKELSPEEYDEWVVRNSYSKPISFKRHVAVNRLGYVLSAYGNYNDHSHDSTPIFYARFKELNHEIWPLFQHFVHLLTDRFSYIRYMQLIPQADILSLLDAPNDCSDHARIQCEELTLDFDGNSLKFFNWIKDHVRCIKFRVGVRNNTANRDKQLLDFFASKSRCASEIAVIYIHISKTIVVGLVQKFMGLKNCDEYHIVESIESFIEKGVVQFVNLLKRKYADFIVKEERNHIITTHIFEFVNENIGKKLQLTANSIRDTYCGIRLLSL